MSSAPRYMTRWLYGMLASDLTCGTKAVLTATVWRYANANNGYTAYVSIPKAVELAHVGKNTAARALTEGRATGWIAVVREHAPGQATRYRATNPLEAKRTAGADAVGSTRPRTQNGYDPRTQNGDDVVPKTGTSRTQNGYPVLNSSDGGTDAAPPATGDAAKRPDESVAEWRRRVAQDEDEDKADAATPPRPTARAANGNGRVDAATRRKQRQGRYRQDTTPADDPYERVTAAMAGRRTDLWAVP